MRPRAARGQNSRRPRARRGERKGQLTPHEPFDLIRLLARSQSDPRKALAELVQNSLDARALRVQIVRVREKGRAVLRIADDGEGVLPDVASREDALDQLARNIGHSRKHGLTPEERRGALGRYGIGLLGFWAMGEELELRTRVRGEPPWSLHLREDEADYSIKPARLSPAGEGDPLSAPTCTEVVVRGVHEGVLGSFAGRRLSDYLATELRGQILESGARILVRDGFARGRAPRLFPVEPSALEGAALLGPLDVAVPGHRPVAVELRFVPEGSKCGVSLSCEGAIVAEDLSREASLALDHLPWTDRRLGGLADFPDLAPAPGSRRGIVPNKAAEALRVALLGIEDQVAAALRQLREAPARKVERGAVERLRRTFLNLARELPRYALLAPPSPREDAPPSDPDDARAHVPDRKNEPGTGDARQNAADPSTPADAALPDAVSTEPGELVRVTISPATVVVAPGGSREVRAVAQDDHGRPIDQPLTFLWDVDDPELATASALDGPRARVTAHEHEGTTSLRVLVTTSSGRSVDATAPVRVRLSFPGGRDGVPAPILVDDASAAWRTRLLENDRWEVNSGHHDYQLVRDNQERWVEYLSILFAREIVHRSLGGDPHVAPALDALVEVTAYALRRL